MGGVWIFFMLSGYGIGKGFFARRYEQKGWLRDFYWNRFIRIAPLYYFAVFVVCVFAAPEILALQNLRYLLPVLTFTYAGNQPLNPVGALWFVSTLMWLYALTPLLWVAVRRFAGNRWIMFGLIVAFMVGGLGLRLAPYVVWPGRDFGQYWYATVYTPPWMNLDLYFVGFFMSAFTRGRSQTTRRAKLERPFAILMFSAVAIASSWFAMRGTQWGNALSFQLLFVVFPSIYLVAVCLWFLFLDSGPLRTPISLAAAAANPLRVPELLAPLTFGVFLWHSQILGRVAPLYKANGPLRTYAVRFVVVFVLSVAMATATYFAIELPAARLKRRRDPVGVSDSA